MTHNNTATATTDAKKKTIQQGIKSDDIDPATAITTSYGHTECFCDFVSVDCLDSIVCMPKLKEESLQLVAKGILTRQFIKNTVKFEGEAFVHKSTPIGKGLQYKSISAWLSWIEHNIIPADHQESSDYIFVNASRHEYCKENQLLGLHCFFTPFHDKEEYNDILEEEAVSMLESQHANTPSNDIEHEERQLMNHLKDIQQNMHPGGETKSSPIDYLTSFAHLLRIQFNRRESLVQVSNRAVTYNSNPQHIKQSGMPPLRVSLHMRRADACMVAGGSPMPNGRYAKVASPLHSNAQQFSTRICNSALITSYDTWYFPFLCHH